MEVLYGPGCFGTGPLAASADSEAPPYPQGTTFSLFTLFTPQIFQFSPPFTLFPPLASLSTH